MTLWARDLGGTMAYKHVSMVLVFGVLILAGCVGVRTDKMMEVSAKSGNVEPESGKATVVFMRSARVSGSYYQASIFDITDGPPEIIGIVSSDTRFAHQSPPGPRRFMVIGETADFMDADLLEGKVYFVEVDPRSGWWKMRYSLIPYHKQDLMDPDFHDICSGCDWLTTSAASRTWAQNNMGSIREKMADSLPDWLASSDKDKLLAHDHQ